MPNPIANAMSRRSTVCSTGSQAISIVEIKPNNADAIAKGRERSGDYASVRELFQGNKSRIKEAFDGKLAVFQKCIANDAIKLETQVHVYELCPPEGTMFYDFVVTE
jgi:hypothetical protein